MLSFRENTEVKYYQGAAISSLKARLDERLQTARGEEKQLFFLAQPFIFKTLLES